MLYLSCPYFLPGEECYSQCVNMAWVARIAFSIIGQLFLLVFLLYFIYLFIFCLTLEWKRSHAMIRGVVLRKEDKDGGPAVDVILWLAVMSHTASAIHTTCFVNTHSYCHRELLVTNFSLPSLSKMYLPHSYYIFATFSYCFSYFLFHHIINQNSIKLTSFL